MRLYFSRATKRVYVYRDRIVSPAKGQLISSAPVWYRESVPELIPVAIAGVFSVLLIIVALGAVGVLFAFILFAAMVRISNYLKDRRFSELRSRYPESLVMEIVRRGYEACLAGSTDIVTLSVGSTSVEVLCGQPKRCAEYYPDKLGLAVAILSATSAALLVAYFMLPWALPVVCVASAVAVCALSKVSICRRYAVDRAVEP